MSSGVIVPRPASRLPVELTQRNSDLDTLITIASDSAELRSFGFESTIRTTRSMLLSCCPDYSPSEVAGDNAILCSSGEEDGNPRAGRQCIRCRAGQFSRGGMFTGEMVSDEIPAFMHPQSGTSVVTEIIKSTERLMEL